MEEFSWFQRVQGLCWTHVGPQKFQTQKEKCWTFVFRHFEALVLSSNRKDFPLEVDFGASWAMFRPILGRFGASRQPAGLQFELRRKESLRLDLNI